MVTVGSGAGGERAGANVNTLNPGRKADMGENSCVHSVEVTVTRLT